MNEFINEFRKNKKKRFLRDNQLTLFIFFINKE